MNEFTGNSDLKKAVQPNKVEPVTTNVIIKKESGANKLAKKFFAKDLKSTAAGVFNDIVIPGTKNLIVNILKRGVDYLFMGGSAPQQNYTSYSSQYYGGGNIPARNVSFSPNYNPNAPIAGNPAPVEASASTVYNVNSIWFQDRGQAEEVLARLKELIDKYGAASVADLYDLIGHAAPFTSNKFGWKDLSGAQLSGTFNGYHIIFPRIIPIE